MDTCRMVLQQGWLVGVDGERSRLATLAPRRFDCCASDAWASWARRDLTGQPFH